MLTSLSIIVTEVEFLFSTALCLSANLDNWVSSRYFRARELISRLVSGEFLHKDLEGDAALGRNMLLYSWDPESRDLGLDKSSGEIKLTPS